MESDPIGLMGGTNTYGYVAANALGVIDQLGLLGWSYSPAQWKSDLGANSTYFQYPGAPGVPLPGWVGGTTGIDWSIDSECECVGDGFQLKEFHVRLTPIVRLRSSYPGGDDQASWSRRAEGDHVQDLNVWQAGSGREAAAAAEQAAKKRKYGSREECQRANQAIMSSTLTSSYKGAAALSHQHWDAGPLYLHSYDSPWRRP